MRILTRTLKKTVARAMGTFPAVLVTGPRQSGKTTLLRSGWTSSHRYVSLENPDTRERALSDPVGFFRDHPPPLILDEIQYAPELLHYVKTAIDEDRNPGYWLLSGSQNFPVMEGVTQTLAGRIAVFSLLPMSLEEAAGAGGRSRDLDSVLQKIFEPGRKAGARRPVPSLKRWILRGAYPEPCLRGKVDRKIWCASYIQTYLERDVRQITKVGDLATFQRFLRLCAARTGQVLNMSTLSGDVGVSVPTVKRWLSILEASHQVFLLPPYFRNLGKRIVKSPKLYFLDTGLVTFLTGIHSEEAALQGPLAGALVETAVVAGWVKAYLHRGEPPALYFWRSRDGLEVDLIVDRNGVLYPMEVKSTATVRPGHASSLEKWLDLAGDASAGRGVIFADVRESMSVTQDVRAVPWNWI